MAPKAHAILSPVHPRIRGEDKYQDSLAQIKQGSPPHTRGRSAEIDGRVERDRFTPAYAGKIRGAEMVNGALMVHPRIRGEDSAAGSTMSVSGGSPPHTRGRSSDQTSPSYHSGFTPAYAGKIRSAGRTKRSFRVHPRIRGEDQMIRISIIPPRGSPPHTRGRL